MINVFIIIDKNEQFVANEATTTFLIYLLDLTTATAGLFMTTFVLTTLNSPFFSAAIISVTDFNILGVALAFHFKV